MTDVLEPTTVPLSQRLQGWDCIEFWVGNARTTAGFLMSAFGFECTGYAGPETGVRDKASYVLDQGTIRFVITGASACRLAGRRARAHPRRRRARPRLAGRRRRRPRSRPPSPTAPPSCAHRGPTPTTNGALSLATVATYGETQHTFVDRRDYFGPSLAPGYATDDLLPDPVGPRVGLTAIDHVVANVERGPLDHWVSSTSGCWASRSWCTSTTTRSRRSTRR